MTKKAFAIAAHPDDIEFQMAGTLILLQGHGYEIHYMNLANGSCGTNALSKAEIIQLRRQEAKAAARLIGAYYHDSLVDDLSIFYTPELLARLAAILRQVSPEILLLQSPQDYMEDHQNTVRLAATAAFVMGMPNFPTNPSTDPVDQPVAIYHAQPHGNCDILSHPVIPQFYVDIVSVLDLKVRMLACHKSQKKWLDQTQGMNAYLETMKHFAREVGTLSGTFTFAEGWRKRLHFGFADAAFSPLEEALTSYVYKPV